MGYRRRRLVAEIGMYLAPELVLRRRNKRVLAALRSGICFIHIPKTAGVSVSLWLYGFSVGHRRWHHYRDLDPDAFHAAHKIAVTRDPIDRFISAYRYLRAGGGDLGDMLFGRRYVAPHGINEFAARLTEPRFRARVLRYFHFHPQVDYVMDGDRLMVDTLLPFDRLNDLPAVIGRERPLPALNRTGGEVISRDALTPETVSVIREIYSADFALHERARGQG